MKTILTLIACGGTLAACGPSSAGGDDVVASFYPLAFAAQQVGGDGLRVRNLTPPGAEPHDLEISPRDVESIRSAKHVLLLGRGFQPQLERAAGSRASVVRLLDTPGLDRFRNDDPHVWLDPVRYAVLVRRVAGVLGRSDGATSMLEALKSLDALYRRRLAHCARHEIVTSHEAFAYLADRYGLREVAVSGLSPEAQVKPGDLQRTIRRVHDTGATTVFFETLVSPRVAKTVARESGARTAVLNPLEGLTDEEIDRGEDYFSVMQDNLAALRKALGCL